MLTGLSTPIGKYLMFDFFSGAGGLSLGLKEAGFEPRFAFDNDRHACETYELNLGGHIYQGEASSLSPEVIWNKTGLKKGDITLVCGGPPCQGFSVQRRGQRVDDRNDLVAMFALLAVEIAPSVILMENVPGLFGNRGAEHLKTVTRILVQNGYEFAIDILDAANFGVPQHRNRAFVVAWQPDRVDGFIFPKPTHSKGEWISVRKAISDLPEPPGDFTEHPKFANHTRVRMSALNTERIAHVPPGGGRSDIPDHLQLRCHKNDNGHRHLDVYGRLEWSKPSATITAMFDNFTRGRFAHPEQNRSITGREGARIQSFSDSFKFCGPKKDVARQIGNAVPPLLARRLGEAIISMLESDRADRFLIKQIKLPYNVKAG
jgi:DNA (cytosine-5)-methyltransferase 1